MDEEAIDSAALAVLVAQHRRFREFLERRVGGRAEAEEILQAAFVKALEQGGELRDGERVVAWFYRLLRNAVVLLQGFRALATAVMAVRVVRQQG